MNTSPQDSSPTNRRLEQLLADLHHEDAQTRVMAAEQLADRADPQVLEPLLQAVRRVHSEMDPVIQATERALTSCGEIGLNKLLHHVEDPDNFTRSLFLRILGAFEDARALERLIVALNDPYDFARLRAAEALARIGRGRYLPRLLNVLTDAQQPPRMRATLTISIGLIRDTRAVDALLAIAEDKHRWVRMAAISTLSQFEDERILDVVLRAARDRAMAVRRSAVLVLRERNDERAKQAVATARADRHILVRRAAMYGVMTPVDGE